MLLYTIKLCLKMGVKHMHTAVTDGCRENMEKFVDELAYPALLLDEEFRICHKNSFCLSRLIPLRLGASIKNYVNAADFKRIEQQNIGQTLRMTIETPTLCGVFVYRGKDCRFVGLRPLTATLQNRLNELMKLNSELTESLMCQMSAISAGSVHDGISELIKNKCNRIIRSQTHISEFLRIINGVKNTKTQLCDIDAILNSIIPSLRDALRPIGIQINYNVSEENIYSRSAQVCEPDFNLILCLMIYNCIRISQSGKLMIDVNSISGKLYISVMTDSVLPKEIAKFICEGDLETENFSSPDSWMYFELLLSKKLCEYYFWNMKMSAPGSDYSRIQFTLSMPLECKKASEFIIKSKEASERERIGLIALEFADIFDR